MGLYDLDKDERQIIQIAPLIDIVFITLIFFMTLSIFHQLEAELRISVPRAKQAEITPRSPGEIIINILRDGTIVVNQKTLTLEELELMLKRLSSLFPNQPVIVRADKETYHKYVIKVLDACASADIWNVAFSAIKEKVKYKER